MKTLLTPTGWDETQAKGSLGQYGFSHDQWKSNNTKEKSKRKC